MRDTSETSATVVADGDDQADTDRPRWQSLASRYHWVIALSAYTILTIVITFPLIFHLGDRIIGTSGEGDNLSSIWSVWQYRTAVLSGQDPAYTHLIYALVPKILVFVPSAFNSIVGGILLTFATPITMYNLLVLIGFPLSGLTMYLLAHEFVKSRLACFVSGFIFTFSTFHFWRAEGHLALSSLEWLPFFVWRVFAFYRRPTPANAVLMGIGIAMVPLTEFYTTAYFLVPFSLLFVIWLLITDRGWLAKPRHLLLTGLGIVVAAALAVPILYSSFRVDPSLQAAINNSASGGTELYSSDLLTYFLPHPLNPWLGWIGSRPYLSMTSGPSVEQANYLGWVTLLFGLGAFVFARNRTRLTALWLALAIFGGLISLGPVVHIAGHAYRRVPNFIYDLIYRFPVLSNFRAPNRAGPTVLLPMALLAAYGLQSAFTLLPRLTSWLGRLASRLGWLASRLEQIVPQRLAGINYPRAMAGGLCVLAMSLSLFENIQFAFPYPNTATSIPSVYYDMARDPVPGLVLALPVYPRGSDEYYQIIHHRGLVDGYPIRVSLPMELSIENVPYLSYFDPVDDDLARDPNAPQDAGFGDVFPIAVSFKQGLEDKGIRYVVYNTESESLVQPWMGTFLRQQLGTPFYDNASEHLTVWRIDPTTVAPDTITYSMAGGWLPGLGATSDHKLIRSIQQDGQLIITTPHAGPLHVTITAFAQLLSKTMVVTLDGRPVVTHKFAQPFMRETVDLGTLQLHAGANTIQMHASEGCTVPEQLYPNSSSDTRCFSFTVMQVQGLPQ